MREWLAAGRSVLPALVLAALAGPMAQTAVAQAEQQPGPAAHRATEDRSRGVWQGIELQDLEGRTWTADELIGRVVVLDFWATWCTVCRADFPHLKALRARYGQDLLVLGIALDTVDKRTLISFLRRHELDWPQIRRPKGFDDPLADRWAVTSVPAVRVIDRRGRWVASDLRGRALALTVAQLLDPID